MRYDIFISYSRKDFDEVIRLRQYILERIPELKIWFDIDGIESGEEFEDKIISAINNSAYVVFAISENSINSRWTKDEVMYAKNIGKKVIPVLLKDAQLKDWFLFKFGRVDCIDSTNPLQVQKLLQNISDWCNKQRKQEATQQKPAETPSPQPVCVKTETKNETKVAATPQKANKSQKPRKGDSADRNTLYIQAIIHIFYAVAALLILGNFIANGMFTWWGACAVLSILLTIYVIFKHLRNGQWSDGTINILFLDLPVGAFIVLALNTFFEHGAALKNFFPYGLYESFYGFGQVLNAHYIWWSIAAAIILPASNFLLLFLAAIFSSEDDPKKE